VRRLGGLIIVLLLMTGGFASSAGADTYVPTRFDDPQPGQCKPNDCSLREAIRKANDHSGLDTVVLGRGTYELELEPNLGFGDDGQLVTADPIVIRGRGPKETRIDANGIDRVITVGFPRGTLEGVTLKGGEAAANPSHANEGGGLLATGEKVVLRDVAIRDNEAQFGGGISARSPQLTIKDSTIAKNFGQEGGGIDIRAAIVQNTMSIRSSTISGNQATNGGGIMADGTKNPPQEISPLVTMDNSTIAENFALASAGGIAAGQNTIAVLRHTTVAYNTADTDGVGGGAGGGLHQQNNAPFQFTDSVLANNVVGDSGTNSDCFGTFDGAGSLVQNPNFSPNCTWDGLFDPVFTNETVTAELGSHGGPTRTVPLLPGSPAIGIALSCPSKDQRGKPRPEEGCDAGAYERQNP
jgi:hypothetical protein